MAQGHAVELLDGIDVRGAPGKRVELLRGDLTEWPADEAFDLLVVSAFPYDYTPTPSSLIGALHRKGLSVQALAGDKSIDLRQAYSCWLSQAFDAQAAGLRFRHILCFEPLVRGSPPEVVGDIFRALTPIVAERPDIRTVAMPVVAVGDQGYPLDTVLRPLLEAALHWLEIGLPLERIKIVTRGDEGAQQAAQLFAAYKARYGQAAPASAPAGVDYDVFISYSRRNVDASEALEQALRRHRPGIRIFVDRKDLNIGAAWQPEIFETLDRCRRVVALLTPDYLGSKVCKEEYNIAWIRARETEQDIIFPVYLYTAPLPTYMKYRNYFDCREGDASRLADASRKLLAELDGGGQD